MTRQSLERLARDAFESLPGDCQERVAQRVVGQSALCWSTRNTQELLRIYGLCRAQALIFVE